MNEMRKCYKEKWYLYIQQDQKSTRQETKDDWLLVKDGREHMQVERLGSERSANNKNLLVYSLEDW